MIQNVLTLNTYDQCQLCRYCCWNDSKNMFIIFTTSEVNAVQEICQKMPRFVPYKESTKVFQIELRHMRRESGSFYYVCPFLDLTNHQCIIYKKRPLDCKLWPFFYSEGKTSGKVNISYFAKSCPSLYNASASVLAFYQEYIIEIMISTEYLQLLREYPELIWEYKNKAGIKKLMSIELGFKK